MSEPLEKSRSAQKQHNAGSREACRDGFLDAVLLGNRHSSYSLQRYKINTLTWSIRAMTLHSKRTFIGCTVSGTPNTIPVKIFHMPEKTSVADKEMEPLTARAIMIGRSVPKSPSDPEISESVESRKVATLFEWCKDKESIIRRQLML